MLRESGIEFEKVNYITAPLSEKKLRELLAKMNRRPRELLRTNEAVYRELQLGLRDLSDDEIIALMVKYPELIQRPIIERGRRAVLGRPVENIETVIRDE